MKLSPSTSLAILALAVIVLPLPAHSQSMCNPVSNNPLGMASLCSSTPPRESTPARARDIPATPAASPLMLTVRQINSLVLRNAPPIQAGDNLLIRSNRTDFSLEILLTHQKHIINVHPPEGAQPKNGWIGGRITLGRPGIIGERVVGIKIRQPAPGGAPLLFRGIKFEREGRVILALDSRLESPPEASAFEPPMSYPPDPMVPNPHLTNVSLSGADLLGRQPQAGFLGPASPAYSMNPMMFQSTTTSIGDPNHYKFSGKELDPETGLYNFGARYYNPAIGRYMSPDWAAGPATVPYADLSNPQTLNLYTFGRNNPMSVGDSDGHCPGDNCGNVQVTVTVDSPPHMIINGKVPGAGGGYVSGAGTTTTITFTGNKGAPLSGMSVKEAPVTMDNLTRQNVANQSRQETVTTGPNGTIHDVVAGTITPVTAEPQNFSKDDLAGMKDVVTTVPYNHTTDQSLTFTTTGANGQPCNCQATYSETMNNANAKGNLNTQNNSQGINMNLTVTKPVVKQVDEKKPDQK